MGKVKISEIEYAPFGKCLKLENGFIELVVTVDVGPRVLRFAVPGKENMMAELPDLTWENGWKIYGGHRLWSSPEAMPRSYELDNTPCHFEIVENGVRLWRDTDPVTGLAKEIEIGLDEETSVVDLLHRIRNDSPWEIEYACWGLSVLSPGGKEVVPLNDRDTGLLANRKMAFWPYDRMNDPRVWWGEKYMTMKQCDTKGQSAYKVGMDNESGWAAYFNHGCLFIKYFAVDLDAEYPDGGMCFETYTNDRFLEMESLSPLELVKPGDTLEHVEVWELMPGYEIPADEDGELDSVLRPVVDAVGCDGDCEHCGHADECENGDAGQ